MPDSWLPEEIKIEISSYGGYDKYLREQEKALLRSPGFKYDDDTRHMAVHGLVVGEGAEVSISGGDINNYRTDSDAVITFPERVLPVGRQYPSVARDRYINPGMPQGRDAGNASSWGKFKLRALKFVANHPKFVKVAGVVIGSAIAAASLEPLTIAAGAALGFVMAEMAVKGAKLKLQSLEKGMSGPAGSMQMGSNPGFFYSSNDAGRSVTNGNLRAQPERSQAIARQSSLSSDTNSDMYTDRSSMADVASLQMNGSGSRASSSMTPYVPVSWDNSASRGRPSSSVSR